MAKGKGKEKAGGGVGPPAAAAAAPQKSLIPLFPPRPKRGPNEKPPGQIVLLISNLFQMVQEKDKLIYKSTVTVDIEVAEEKGDDAGKAPTAKPKLNADLRREAVKKAIEKWVLENKPRDYDNKLQFNYLFDSNGSTIYSLFNLFAHQESQTLEFRVPIDLERTDGKKMVKVQRFFRVKVFKTDPLDMKLLFQYCSGKGDQDISTIHEHTRALNVILRGKISTIPTNLMTPLSVFPFKRENQFQVSPGVIANKGYTPSVRPGQCGLMLNVANTVAAFLEENNLLKLLRDRFRVQDFSRPLQKDIVEKLKKEIFNKQIEATHINYGNQQKPHYRKYRVNDISGSALDKFTLVDKETKTTSTVTIAKYFEDTYKIKLKHPQLPCVIDGARKIPIEVCQVIGRQKVLRRMDPDETAEIIKKAALRPEQHFDAILNNVQEMKKQNQPLREFGFDFDVKPIEVEGRELPPITIVAGRMRELRPANGGYMPSSFYKPTRVNKWAMLFLMDRQVELNFQKSGTFYEQEFAQRYCKQARDYGVQCEQLTTQNKISVERPEQEVKNALKQAFKFLNRSKIDHVIIVLPPKCPDWVYRYIQFVEVTQVEGRAAGERWTRSSCIKYQNYISKIIQGRDGGRMFLSNLWLKYNTKFGGINFVLKDLSNDPKYYNFLADGYVFISIDVCHPAPGDKLTQSVAAAVGMWDLTNDKMSFCTSLRVQKKMREDHSTIEEVGDIGLMVDELLESYRVKKGKLPMKIVILRDGVSEGQFKIVLGQELKKVKQTVQNRYSTAKQPVPPISCLVVQKRHRVRFRRKQPYSTPKGPDFNIQPGTVVDSTVVHPTDFSFYLAPHKAIQGTSRAAHIYMILDEIKFSQDQAQAMVYALSFLSPRCTKSTSIPTPVNLADLAAERAKNIVISWNDDNKVKMDETKRLQELNKMLGNLAEPGYKNTLYYI